jgi:phosphatidylinositol alpha-1,6-mannosyltransferase
MERRPRVLVITPDYPPALGGIQTLVHRIVRQSKRLTTRVVAPAGRDAGRFDVGESIDVRRSPKLGGDRRADMAALNAFAVKEAWRFRPEVVLSAHIVTAPAARMIGRAGGSRTIQYLYADELRGRPKLARFAVNHADAVVAISGYTRQLALEAGADPGKVHRILCGVDPARTTTNDRRADTPTIITVARLNSPYKGHDVVTRALPLVLGRVPDAHWLVVGDGPLLEPLKVQASVVGVSDHVSFLGAVSDERRDELLAAAQVFTMPSRLPASGVGGEGFGIVYLEAGTHHLPVVAGNVAGALDAVVAGETGVLVDPTDHVAVADAIADLLLDPDRAHRLGEGGARRAAELSWPNVAREVEELVLGLVAGRR